jgi:AcrR family transcriptional regulator
LDSLSPRPDVSEERKQQILEAAMVVFARSGFDKARMDDIVEESGLSKGTLYWYFESKDDIIIAILENMFEREFVDLEPLVQADGTATGRLTRIVEYIIADVQQMFTLIPLIYEFYALAYRQDKVQETLKSYWDKYIKVLDPIIQEGIDSGEFRKVNANEASIALGALIEGVILLWVFDPENIDISHHGKISAKFLLDGLQTQT